MEESHPQQQQQQQHKFNNVEDNPTTVFSMNPSSTHQYNHQQPPYIFQQLQCLPTQEFFQYQHHFPALLQPQRRIQDQQQPYVLSQENVSFATGNNNNNITTSSVPCFSLTFKPDLNENLGKNRGLSGGEVALLRGSEHYVPDVRRATLSSPHYCWQNQEDSAIRQPFWKPLCTELSDGSNKVGDGTKDKEVRSEMNQTNNYRGSEETEQINSLESRKARLFGELEEICRNGSINDAKVYRTSSVENFATTKSAAASLPAPDDAKFSAAETSSTSDDEAPSRMGEKIKARKKMKHQLSSMALFFEGLVHELMEHQEILHRKFMEAIEKLDEERKAREEVWRQKELERVQQDAALRTNERALALEREASIVSYLEKITGQSIKLPPRSSHLELGIFSGPINEVSSSNKGRDDLSLRLMNKRWPKVEVEALIQIRSGLEKKFQGPGYKGPLWEDISSSMASMGYQRTAKRCKEKWENINKYFKKSRENSNSKQCLKKLKTCQYFDQLNQLYYKSVLVNNGSNSCSSSSEHQENPNNGNGLSNQMEGCVPAGNLREAGFRDDFNGSINGKLEELKQGSHIKRIDEHHHIDHVEDMKEGEEEDGDDNVEYADEGD